MHDLAAGVPRAASCHLLCNNEHDGVRPDDQVNGSLAAWKLDCACVGELFDLLRIAEHEVHEGFFESRMLQHLKYLLDNLFAAEQSPQPSEVPLTLGFCFRIGFPYTKRFDLVEERVSVNGCFLFFVPRLSKLALLRIPIIRYPACWEPVERNRLYCSTIFGWKLKLGFFCHFVVVPISVGFRLRIQLPIGAQEVDVAHVLDSLLALAEPRQNPVGHGRQRTARVIAGETKTPSSELQWKKTRCVHRCKMAG